MKIQLKRSNVVNGGTAKEPTAEQMQFGELAVNYSGSDPAIFMKDNDGNIIRIAGDGAVGNDPDDIQGYPDLGDGEGAVLDDRYLKLGSFAGPQTVKSTDTTTFDGLVAAGVGVKLTSGNLDDFGTGENGIVGPNPGGTAVRVVVDGTTKATFYKGIVEFFDIDSGIKLLQCGPQYTRVTATTSTSNTPIFDVVGTIDKSDVSGHTIVQVNNTEYANTANDAILRAFRVNNPTNNTSATNLSFMAFDAANLTDKFDKNYSFYGETKIGDGSKENWNFYAVGDAPNYFNGISEFNSGVEVSGGNSTRITNGIGSSGTNLRLIQDNAIAIQVSDTTINNNKPTSFKPTAGSSYAVSFNAPDTSVNLPDQGAYMSFAADQTGAIFDGNWSFAKVSLPSATVNETVSCSDMAGYRVNNSFGRFNVANDGNVNSGVKLELDKRNGKVIYNINASGTAPNYFEGLVECTEGVQTNDISAPANNITIAADAGKVTLSSVDGYRFEGTIESEKGFEMVATVQGPYAADQTIHYGFFYPRVKNYNSDDANRLTQLNCTSAGLYTGNANSATPYIKTKTGFLALSGLGINTWDDADEHVNYGFKSEITTLAEGQNWGFYAEGNADNYMNGSLLVSGSDTFTRKDTTQANSIRGVQISGINNPSISINAYGTGTGQTCLELNRAGSPSGGKYIDFFENGIASGSISCNSGDVSFNETSDYRLKESVTSLSSVIEDVKALNPVSFSYTSNPNYTHLGFVAHELQEVVPQAVTGTKDEMEAIGTLADYNGTVIETDVTEPDEDDLTYEERVEVTPYVEPVEATYDEEGVQLTPAVAEVEATYQTVTRTNTWTSTGTQPVYQGVDKTKLIPLLTKALQEALDKIEALEKRLADAGIA